jgi:hypothetical protein
MRRADSTASTLNRRLMDKAIVKIKSYAAATGSRVTRYPSRSMRRVSWSTT